MSITHEGSAPYAPVAHVLRALDHYRDRGPQVFTKELLVKLGYPDAYAVRTMRALKLLDLIDDDGVPTDSFKELRAANDEEYTSRFEQIIRTAYAEVFEVVDPASASNEAIEHAFRFYNPQAQRGKMVTLFMGLCEAAAIIPPERAPRKRLRTTTSGTSGRKRLAEDGAPNPGKEGKHTPPATPQNPPARDPENPPPVMEKSALKSRYIEVLIEKAATSDDDKLLDRIEALLREDEPKD